MCESILDLELWVETSECLVPWAASAVRFVDQSARIWRINELFLEVSSQSAKQLPTDRIQDWWEKPHVPVQPSKSEASLAEQRQVHHSGFQVQPKSGATAL